MARKAPTRDFVVPFGESILKADTNITMLLNNAGFGATAPFFNPRSIDD